MALALDDDRGAGPALVLVHGLASTRVVWRRATPRLTGGRRVVALDVPGFGASPPADAGFELGAVADAIAHGLREAGIAGPWTIVGHSLGGAVALRLAQRWPADVRALVLVAPAGLRPLPTLAGTVAGALIGPVAAARRIAAPLADHAAGRRLLLGLGAADTAGIAPSDVRALVDASRGATRLREALAAVLAEDLRPVLAELAHPVGALWGAEDRAIAPSGLDTVRSLRPEAPCARLPGVGHLPMMERPEDFALALERVLAELT